MAAERERGRGSGKRRGGREEAGWKIGEERGEERIRLSHMQRAKIFIQAEGSMAACSLDPRPICMFAKEAH